MREKTAGAGTPRRTSADPAVLRNADDRLKQGYLAVWAVAHDPKVGAFDRRLAKDCLYAMNDVLEAAFPAPPEHERRAA